MGSSKRHQRNSKPQAHLRSRTTRSKGKLLSDPALNTQLLTEQLRSLGLYAAPTLGDGNCLFRALSDQLHGTPSHHLQLRKEICDWIESHKQRYEPFVEDERGLDVHLNCMRENGTYGGHLELSAFAHLTRRNVKVIQPGLVYVIEWAAGGDLSPSLSVFPDLPFLGDESKLDEREKRRWRRDQKRAEMEKDLELPNSSTEDSSEIVYVAYHDWEHFSSIRNLKGPHAGLPHVSEVPAETVSPSTLSVPKKPISKIKSKTPNKSHLKPSAINKPSLLATTVFPPTPSQIPLPGSRSPSPIPSSDPVDGLRLLPFPPTETSVSSPPTSRGPAGSANPIPIITVRITRSPKRSFDESSGSSASESQAKRTRSTRLSVQSSRRSRPSNTRMDVDGGAELELEAEPDFDSTPGLSAPGSSAASTTSSSGASSPPLATPPALSPLPPPPPPVSRPLTRRQRKVLGLPKPRAALVGNSAGRNTRTTGAGKIVIPGGRFKKGAGAARVKDGDDDDDDDDDDHDRGGTEEWRMNGTGRLDVRGFRELKI